MTETDLVTDLWPGLVDALSGRIDLDVTAEETGAFRQARGVPDAATLLRLVLAYGCFNSLRATCAWAEDAGVARLSNPALIKRLQHCPDWLGRIVAALMAPSASRLSQRPGLRVRLIDATTLCHPGATQTNWRVHLAFDLAAGRVEHLELTDVHGGERLDRFAPDQGVLDIADAGYASAGQMRDRLAASADVLVRLRAPTFSFG